MNSLRRRSAPSVRMPSLPTPLPAMDTGRLRDPAYTVTVSKTRHARPTLVRTRRPPSDQSAVSRDQPCSKPPSTSACFSSGSGSAPSGQIGCQGLEVVFPAADGVTGHPAHYQDAADDENTCPRLLAALRHASAKIAGTSSNASSSADVPRRTNGHRLRRRSRGHPRYQTDSDGFGRHRARLLIRGFGVRVPGGAPVLVPLTWVFSVSPAFRSVFPRGCLLDVCSVAVILLMGTSAATSSAD